ncbi:MAG: hypothetical protein JNM63_09105, partial [Spirochaetia bacterium]|nr:hypothetical protein [Spirochaetia bacterium]
MNALELKTAIESLSIQQDMDKSAVMEVLSQTILSEFADYLNVQDEDILLESDENYSVNLYLQKEVVDE